MIDIKKLAEDKTPLEQFNSGDVIFDDGDASDNKMYIIFEGCVDVYKNYGQQGEICITTLYPGDFFGEMSLLLDKGRTATIVAKEDVSAFMLDHTNILKFLKDQPETALLFMRTLATRLVATNTSFSDNSVRYEKNVEILNEEKSKAQDAANTDSLTGIYNRRYFTEQAPQMIDAEGNDTSYVILFDLDFFKKVNDTYGHQAGDHVLIVFAQMVRSMVRRGDIFARYGGEEFIMQINGVSESDALAMVERVRERICEDPIEFEGLKIPVSSSIGVAAVSSSENFNDAIAAADIALYRAKIEGRNRTVFYTEEFKTEE